MDAIWPLVPQEPAVFSFPSTLATACSLPGHSKRLGFRAGGQRGVADRGHESKDSAQPSGTAWVRGWQRNNKCQQVAPLILLCLGLRGSGGFAGVGFERLREAMTYLEYLESGHWKIL